MRKQIWNLKQAAEPNVLDMYIYDYIEGDSYDFWTGQTIQSETSANYFRDEMAKYPNVSQINLYVNSYGGYVYEGMSIRNQLVRHPAKVVGIVDGFAASMASYLLTGCDEVRMYSNTMQLLHEMMDGLFGNASEHRKMADELDTLMKGNRKAYLEKSGGKMTEDQLIEVLQKAEWLTAEQCLELGLCDVIIAEEKDLTEASMMMEKHNKSLQQLVNQRQAMQSLLKDLNHEPIEPKPNNLEPEMNKTKQLMAALLGSGTGA